MGSVVFGWVSTPAGGIASNVTIGYSNGAFSGTVQANPPCAIGRQVTVNKGGEVVGTATTDGAGNWTLAKRRARGTFTATVAASSVTVGGTPPTGYGYNGSPGTTVTCDADTSDPLVRQRKKKKRGGGGGGGGGPLPPGFRKLFEDLFPGFNFDIPRF